jgi:hypothetical protein
LSRATNIAYRLSALVQEVQRQSGFNVFDSIKIQSKYEAVVTHALADLEIGMIDGKPVPSFQQAVTVLVAGNNAGNILVGGHGAQQHVSQAQIASQVDLAVLAGEMEPVRAELAKDVTDVIRAVAVVHVAQAEQAAKDCDADSARKALASAGKGAGKWIADAAGKVGTTILTEWVKHQIGM